MQARNRIQPVGIVCIVVAGAVVLLAGRDRSAAPAPLTRKWEKAIAQQSVPQGVDGIRASDCGTCHTDVYEEWRSSAHAKAFVDPQFQAEWMKDDRLWLCLNCHTPLVNQQPFIVEALEGGDHLRPVGVPNRMQDTLLTREGITCAVCHVRNGAVTGSGRATEAPHPVIRSPEVLSYEFCIRCHNAEGRISKTLVCTFDTGDDWLGTDLPASGKDCLTCHMQTVKRPIVDGGPARETKSHSWPGAGIPKFFEDAPSVVPLGALDVEIVPDPEGYVRGEKGRVTVLVSNRRAGHSVPTGDVERFALLKLRLFEAERGRIYWKHEEKIGEVWEWSPEARRISDNSLAYGETRSFQYEIDIPRGTASIFFEVALENHRMTVENAEAMGLLGRYPLKRAVLETARKLELRGE